MVLHDCMVLLEIAVYFIVMHGFGWHCIIMHDIALYCIVLHSIRGSSLIEDLKSAKGGR